MFSWLQDKCGLEDDEEHDLISFIRGLRPEIVEKMNDTKNIHEAYWEAIRVERMLKRYHLVEVSPQEEKSSHVTDCVEEPVPPDMQTDQPELDIDDSTSTVGLEISQMSTNNSEVRKSKLLIFLTLILLLIFLGINNINWEMTGG